MPKDIFALLGMLLTVAAILVLAYFCTRYMAKLKLGRMRLGGKNNRMRILDQLAISNDLRIALVQVGSRYLVVGLSAGGISTLAELTADEALLWDMEPTEDISSPSASPPSFKDSLIETLKQKRK